MQAMIWKIESFCPYFLYTHIKGYSAYNLPIYRQPSSRVGTQAMCLSSRSSSEMDYGWIDGRPQSAPVCSFDAHAPHGPPVPILHSHTRTILQESAAYSAKYQ